MINFEEFDDLRHPNMPFSRLRDSRIQDLPVPNNGKRSEGDSSSPGIIVQKGHESLQHATPIVLLLLGNCDPRLKAHLDASIVGGTPPSPVTSVNNACDTHWLDDGKRNTEEHENTCCNTPRRSGQDDSIGVPNSEISPPSGHPRTSGRYSNAFDRTAPAHGEILNNIGDRRGSGDDMANAQEYHNLIAPLPCKDHDEPLDTLENNHPHKRRRSNSRRTRNLSKIPLFETHQASD
jgi:hypothetical protein